MQKVRKLLKNQEGVSPVIAVILMVAITVVLAAVLYVMVTGLIGENQVANPRVSFAKDATSNQIELRVSVDQSKSSNQYLLLFENVTAGADTTVKVITDCTKTAKCAIAGTPDTIYYKDLTGDERLTEGDSFIIEGTSAGFDYKLSLIFGDAEVGKATF